MHFSLPLAAFTSLVGLASARIDAVSVPKTIKPGDQFDVILHGHNYIQTVDEIAAAFGVSPGKGHPGSLGSAIASVYLGPQKSNTIANYSFPMTVPTSMQEGDATFTTSLFQLYGAADAPTLTEYSVAISLGTETSDDYITTSEPQSQ